MKNGFTILELLVIMGVFAILAGFTTLNLFNLKARASLSTTTDTLISDLKTEQIKAMTGDPSGGSINLATYSFGDFVTAQVNPPGDIVFQKGSGEISTARTIILTDSANEEHKTIYINRLGVVYNVQ